MQFLDRDKFKIKKQNLKPGTSAIIQLAKWLLH